MGKKKKEKKMKFNSRVCAYCNSEMSCRGACCSHGATRWKCKKCGRTIQERKIVLPPQPLVPRNLGVR